jgi:hypothetical protein
VDGGGGAGVEEEGGVGELRVLGSKSEKVRYWAEDWKIVPNKNANIYITRQRCHT